MFGPTPKARETLTDPIDGVPLYWNAHPDGYGIRAPKGPFAVTKESLARAKTDFYFRSEVFEIPTQIDAYRKVMDWILNARGILHKEIPREDPGRPGVWFMWVSWVDVRGRLPISVQLPTPRTADRGTDSGTTPDAPELG